MAQLNGLLVTGNSRFLNKINGDISGDAHTLDGKTITDTYSGTSTNAMSGKAVKQALDGLPEPMVFQGSVGTGGTKTWANLPSPSSTGTTKNVGHTYKAIEARTTSQTPTLTANVKIGDTIISDGTNWVVIPSGDEDGTVTNIATGAELTGGPITSTGTISHSTSGVAAGTYRSVTVNTYGHVTNGTNPTTISGYGITDAKIADGVITLGSNTLTPLTSASTLNATKLSGTVPSGCYTDTKNTTGSTDTSSKIYLVGATSQAANPQTYSDNEVYTTSGVLTTKSTQIGGGNCTLQWNSTLQSCEFIFT